MAVLTQSLVYWVKILWFGFGPRLSYRIFHNIWHLDLAFTTLVSAALDLDCFLTYISPCVHVQLCSHFLHHVSICFTKLALKTYNHFFMYLCRFGLEQSLFLASTCRSSSSHESRRTVMSWTWFFMGGTSPLKNITRADRKLWRTKRNPVSLNSTLDYFVTTKFWSSSAFLVRAGRIIELLYIRPFGVQYSPVIQLVLRSFIWEDSPA